MKRRGTLGGLVLLGLGAAIAACSAGDAGSSNPVPSQSTEQPPAQAESPQPGAPSGPADTSSSGQVANSDVIDVAQQSQVGVALRGSLGPVIDGQTITRSVLTLEDIELVSASGSNVVLMSGQMTTDLLSVQNDLTQLVQQQAIQAGQYTAVRFRLDSAYVETVDAQGATYVYASQGVDVSQFTSVSAVNQLQLGGIGPDGYVTCAVPQGGIDLQGSATLALQFSLAESLTVQQGGAWMFSPRVWAVDASTFSSIQVEYDLSSTSYAQYLSEGFQVLLLDGNLRPCSQAVLVQQSSTLFVASFQYVESFQGPFVAVLLPPAGVSLTSTVATSVSVQQSVTAVTSISVSSLQQVSSSSFAVSTSSQAAVTLRSRTGQVVGRTNVPIGPIEDVAPRERPREPLRPGEQPAPPAPPPHLHGLPAPRGVDAGAPPPVMLDGGMPPVMMDAGGPPRMRDAGGPPPVMMDAGVPRPMRDAGGPPPVMMDAGAPPPPMRDAGMAPPSPTMPPPASTGRGGHMPGFDGGVTAPPRSPMPTPTVQPPGGGPTPTGMPPGRPSPSMTTGPTPTPPVTPAPTPSTGPRPTPPSAPAPTTGGPPSTPTPPTPGIPAGAPTPRTPSAPPSAPGPAPRGGHDSPGDGGV